MNTARRRPELLPIAVDQRKGQGLVDEREQEHAGDEEVEETRLRRAGGPIRERHPAERHREVDDRPVHPRAAQATALDTRGRGAAAGGRGVQHHGHDVTQPNPRT